VSGASDASFAQREIISQHAHSGFGQLLQVRTARIPAGSQHPVLRQEDCDFVTALFQSGGRVGDELRIAGFKWIARFDEHILGHLYSPSGDYRAG
jgi:hypothetical protein